MNVGSLFSGIGGLDLGLHQAGHQHVFFCESDPYRRDVLRARWPGVPVYEDVHAGWDGGRVVRGEGTDGRATGAVGQQDAAACGGVGSRLQDATNRGSDGDARQGRDGLRASVDLLCGGFPCQDLSVAGKRRGLDGARSGLFFEFARIIESVRPGWLLVENVPGLLSSNGGRDFGIVLGTLADLGYGMAWRILDSRFFGVPQRRRRVFILGALAHGDPRAAAERAGQVLAVGSGCARHLAPRGEAWEGTPVASLSGLGSGGPDDNDGQGGRLIANPLEASDGHHGYSSPRGDGADNLITIGDESTGADDGEPTDADAWTGEPDPNEDAVRFALERRIAAPLTKDSATGEGVNQPGRRQEDDVNLISFDAKHSNQGSPSEHAVLTRKLRRAISSEATRVRRLTPTECERLQGFPDDWTQLGKTPDSRRYSALGDAVTVNVAEWIGGRLA